MKRARLHKRLVVAAMLAAAGCAACLLQPDAPRPEQNATAAMPAATASAAPAVLRVSGQPAPAARRVYPYSIVPGGVASRAELAQAVMADKVVAAHYAGFAVDKASLHTVGKARAVYVSYRKGEQVYWTAHKVTLAEGETVLSDGRNDIRARCGNRISDTPQLPVEAKGPGEQELDTPVEQAHDGGALREAGFALDEQIGEGERFALQSFADGAGLLSAAHPEAGQARFVNAGPERMAFANLPTLGYKQGASARPPAPAAGTDSGTDSGTTEGSTADSGTPGGTEPAAGGSGGVPDGTAGSGGSAGGTGSTGTSGGTTGTGAGGGTAGKPGLGSDSLPNGTVPPKTHEVPEPDSLWLTGVAAAALLLQRRLLQRRQR